VCGRSVWSWLASSLEAALTTITAVKVPAALSICIFNCFPSHLRTVTNITGIIGAAAAATTPAPTTPAAPAPAPTPAAPAAPAAAAAALPRRSLRRVAPGYRIVDQVAPGNASYKILSYRRIWTVTDVL
jgi:hypothetical protein